MSDPNKDIVEIDSDLKSRLAALASRSGLSVGELARDILRDHADRQEVLIAEYTEDEARWQRYLETGETIAFETVRAKLQGLAAEAAHKQNAS